MAKTEITDLIIPLGVVAAGIYLAPNLKEAISGIGQGASTAVQGAGTGISDAFTGAGSGLKEAFQGTGTGISTATQGLGTGISKLGTGAGQIFESTGKAGGGFIESVGGFGSKIFDTGSSFVDIFDAGFDKTSESIRNINVGGVAPVNNRNIEVSKPITQSKVSSNNSSSIFKSALTTALKLNPITAPIGYASSLIQKFSSNSSKSSTSSKNASTKKSINEILGLDKEKLYTPISSTSSSNKISKLSSSSKKKSSSSGSVVTKTDALSGKNKNKGSYIVTKSDGSKVKRYFQ